MVRAVVVDAAVDQLITEWFGTPVMARTVIPGNEAEVDSQLEEIRFAIGQLGSADLDDEEYDRRLAELRAGRDRLRRTEIVPDRVELTDTGERYSELWARTGLPERGPWLARHGFRVTASKAEVKVAKGEYVVPTSL